MSKPTLLIICPHAPPSTAAASGRMAGLLRHLPDLGYRPVILTAVPGEDPRGGRRIFVPDVDMAELATRVRRWVPRAAPVGSEAHAELTGLREPLVRSLAYSVATFPDRHWPWATRVSAAASRFIRDEPEMPVALLTSSPPEASHLAGWSIARRFGIPWTADLRDLWSQNPYSRQLPLRIKLDAALERLVLKSARTLVTVSGPFAERLEELHRRPARVVPNGVDLAAYESLDSSIEESATAGPLTFLHTGSLYGGRRNPEPLFRAISTLVRAGTIDEGEIQVDFVGRDSSLAVGIANDHGLAKVVRALPVEPRALALERQRAAGILLLLLRDHPSERGIQPAKVFEYIAARRPILGIGFKGGVTDDLLRDTGVGRLFSSTAVADLTTWLRTVVENRRSIRRRPEFLGDVSVIRAWGQDRMARSMLAAMDLKAEV